jgi:DNA repair photolyase
MRWRSADEGGHEDEPGNGQVVLFDDVVERHIGRGEFRGMEFLHVNARRIINEVPRSSPVPFRHTINAYRGCSHACTYCFARPTHEYLDMNSGVDFERRIVVKVNAVERLRAELAPARWAGHHIAMGTNTDPYQRCEGKYRLTRGIVEVLAQARNPFSILTKSTLILRDLDVLAEAATHADVRADLSIGTLDEHVWRTTEPGTPHPLRRVEAVARLNAAGIPCGVLVAPVLPGISDAPEQVEVVVKACIDAGAVSIAAVLLHLRPGVREHWFEWLHRERPELVDEHESLYPRAYAPKARQKELSDLVGGLLRRHGRGPTSTERSRYTRVATPAAPPRPAARQLPLDL